jgi:hypothetical protein
MAKTISDSNEIFHYSKMEMKHKRTFDLEKGTRKLNKENKL